MFGRHPSLQDREPEPEQRSWFTDPDVPARACCCPGQPAVKIIMPPAPGRDNPVDLWLCRHHYRASAETLRAAGAIAEDVRFTDDVTLDDRAPVAV